MDPGEARGPTVSDDLFPPAGRREVRQQDMVAELKREIAVRKHVYPRWVERHKIDGPTADWRILVLEAVLEEIIFIGPAPGGEPRDNRARSTDPETSHAAARKSNAGKSATDLLILADLRKNFDKGGTTLEISKRIDRENNNISPRFSPLEDAGYIYRTNELRKDLKTKCSSHVWRVR